MIQASLSPTRITTILSRLCLIWHLQAVYWWLCAASLAVPSIDYCWIITFSCHLECIHITLIFFPGNWGYVAFGLPSKYNPENPCNNRYQISPCLVTCHYMQFLLHSVAETAIGPIHSALCQPLPVNCMLDYTAASQTVTLTKIQLNVDKLQLLLFYALSCDLVLQWNNYPA